MVTRAFEAARALVFDAWTRYEHLPNWMTGPEGWTMAVCEIDLRPGGASRLVWRDRDGAEMEIRGEYREIERPERLVSTESWSGDWPETLNSLILSETDGQTTAVLTIRYPSREARDGALESGMREGMALSYERLDGYLSWLD